MFEKVKRYLVYEKRMKCMGLKCMGCSQDLRQLTCRVVLDCQFYDEIKIYSDCITSVTMTQRIGVLIK